MRSIKHVKPSVAAGAAGVAVLLVAAGYGAMAGPHRARAADPPKVARPAVVGQGRLSLPLDAYHLNVHQNAVQTNAINVVTRACMKSYGIAYLVNVPDVTAQVEAGFTNYDSRRYGVTDPAAVVAYGYHLPPPASQVKVASHPPQPALSAQQNLVLTGIPRQLKKSMSAMAGVGSAAKTVGTYNGKPIPEGGCVDTATRALHVPVSTGSEQKANQLAADLQQQDFLKAQSDPRVHAVFRRWSACMASHGYHYSSPIAAATDPRWKMKEPPVRTEVQTAITDVKCKQDTRLVTVEYQVETALQNASIKKNTPVLAPLKKQVAAQITALRNVTAKYGH